MPILVEGIEFDDQRVGKVLIGVKHGGKTYPFALFDEVNGILVLIGADGSHTPLDLHRRWQVQLDKDGEIALWLVTKTKLETYASEAEAIAGGKRLEAKFPGSTATPRKTWGEDEVY